MTLTDREVDLELASQPGWRREDDALVRFTAAEMRLVAKVNAILDEHPSEAADGS